MSVIDPIGLQRQEREPIHQHLLKRVSRLESLLKPPGLLLALLPILGLQDQQISPKTVIERVQSRPTFSEFRAAALYQGAISAIPASICAAVAMTIDKFLFADWRLFQLGKIRNSG